MKIVDFPLIGQLTPTSAGLSMSPEEFDAIADYDDTVYYELINGVLVVTPISSRSDRAANDLLGHWLRTYQQGHCAETYNIDTIFNEYLRTRDNRRRADRVIWVARGDSHPEPDVDIPTIVVEFVSPGKAAWRRDYIEKRDEYLEAGVLEYWVIDRFRRQLNAYYLQAGKPAERVVNEHEIYRPDLLPGFELPLAELLAAADRWGNPV